MTLSAKKKMKMKATEESERIKQCGVQSTNSENRRLRVASRQHQRNKRIAARRAA